MKHRPPQLLEVAGGKPIKLWTHGVPVEDAARRQLINTAQLPFIFKHLAVMPDVHLGKGSTIGSVIPTLGAIIPVRPGVGGAHQHAGGAAVGQHVAHLDRVAAAAEAGGLDVDHAGQGGDVRHDADSAAGRPWVRRGRRDFRPRRAQG